MSRTISAVVMIYNEEKQIRQCLETIRWADEIVICDSFSTDRTIEICREFTGKIYQRRFDNFGNQKRWLMDKPSGDWVLFVEADERFPPSLALEIRRRIDADEGYDGYWMPFRNFILGREMKGDYWQFKKIKLFRNGKGGWQDKLVHVSFVLNGKAGELSETLLHYPYPDLGVMLMKQGRFTTLEARQLIQRGTRVSLADTLKALAWIPARFYIFFFKLKDYRSGWPGLLFALVTSFYTIMINIKYWNMRLSGSGCQRG